MVSGAIGAPPWLFQFHKGAIRTYGASSKVHQFGYFNSIKVRLELPNHMFFGLLPNHFNSIKVRLERLLRNEHFIPISISIP